MYGKFDPSGDRFGYVSKNDLFVEDIATGQVTQLTSDGSETIINGNFDWVYEEEFFMPLPADGWRWAPDGESIAYWQLDAEGIGVFDMINNTDSIYSYTIPVQYPKTGQDPSSAKIGTINTETKPTRRFPPVSRPIPATSVINSDHRSHDVPNLFICDGSSLVSSTRGQPTMTIMALAFRAADRIKAVVAAGDV